MNNNLSKAPHVISSATGTGTTLPLIRLALIQNLFDQEHQKTSSSGDHVCFAHHQLTQEMASKSDQLCSYVNFVQPQKGRPATYIYNLSSLFIQITMKYGLMSKKTNAKKNLDEIYNVLGMYVPTAA